MPGPPGVRKTPLAENERDVSKVPAGMICRLDRLKDDGRILCILGWPTLKGNFSIGLGKWHGIGQDEGEAIDKALLDMQQNPLKK